MRRRGFLGVMGSAALGLSIAWNSSVIPKPFKVSGWVPDLEPTSDPLEDGYRVEIGGEYETWDAQGKKIKVSKPPYSFVLMTPLLRAKADKFHGRPERQHAQVDVAAELDALEIVGYKPIRKAVWQTTSL